MSSIQCEQLFNPINICGQLGSQLHTEVEEYSHFEKKLKVAVVEVPVKVNFSKPRVKLGFNFPTNEQRTPTYCLKKSKNQKNLKNKRHRSVLKLHLN